MNVSDAQVTNIMIGGVWHQIEPGSFKVGPNVEFSVIVAVGSGQAFECRVDGQRWVGWFKDLQAVRC